MPSQSRLPPCQLPQRGSQVCALPKACAKPSLASPFGGGAPLWGAERARRQRPSPMGCVEALAGCPLSRLTATAPPRGEPSMCATKSLCKAKSRLPLWGRCHAFGMTERARRQRPAHIRVPPPSLIPKGGTRLGRGDRNARCGNLCRLWRHGGPPARVLHLKMSHRDIFSLSCAC